MWPRRFREAWPVVDYISDTLARTANPHGFSNFDDVTNYISKRGRNLYDAGLMQVETGGAGDVLRGYGKAAIGAGMRHLGPAAAHTARFITKHPIVSTVAGGAAGMLGTSLALAALRAGHGAARGLYNEYVTEPPRRNSTPYGRESGIRRRLFLMEKMRCLRNGRLREVLADFRGIDTSSGGASAPKEGLFRKLKGAFDYATGAAEDAGGALASGGRFLKRVTYDPLKYVGGKALDAVKWADPVGKIAGAYQWAKDKVSPEPTMGEKAVGFVKKHGPFLAGLGALGYGAHRFLKSREPQATKIENPWVHGMTTQQPQYNFQTRPPNPESVYPRPFERPRESAGKNVVITRVLENAGFAYPQQVVMNRPPQNGPHFRGIPVAEYEKTTQDRRAKNTRQVLAALGGLAAAGGTALAAYNLRGTAFDPNKVADAAGKSAAAAFFKGKLGPINLEVEDIPFLSTIGRSTGWWSK